MTNLYKILDLMGRIDENYHQYTMLINEDKRGKAAKNACYNVFRQYFNNGSFLDQEFVHQDNPEHLSAIDYMYKQFMDEFYHDPATRAGAVMRLAPMFLRLALESGFQQGHDDAYKLNRLRNILNYIHQSNKTKGLDISQISVNTTFDELNNTFGKEIDNQNASMKDRINNGVYDENNNFNGYKIVGPLTFEEANRYGNASCPDSKLCYTQGSNTWDRYTANDINNVYVLLRDGWENVPPEHDDESNSAYDTYGLSMIFVFVDGQGDLAYCNTRWNHGGERGANYKSGSSCDHALNEEEITQLIGRNFYKVFKPNNKWNELVENALTRLKNGEDPNRIFEYFDKTHNVVLVKLSNKWNFIDSNFNLLSEKWFDIARKFTDNGVAVVMINGKYNAINTSGEYISEQWFDMFDDFEGNLAVVFLGTKMNAIKTNGELVSDTWYTHVSVFSDRLIRVSVGDKYSYQENLMDEDGQLISDQWYEMIGKPLMGYCAVVLEHRYNFIDLNGNLRYPFWIDQIGEQSDSTDCIFYIRVGSKWNYINLSQGGDLISDEWFDQVWSFSNDYGRIKNNGKLNFIDKNGRILSDVWFDGASNFSIYQDVAPVTINDKYYFIDKNGNLIPR